MDALERKALLDEIAAMVLAGELELGDAVRVLRSSVLGMDRETFAKVVKLSKRAIAQLEDSRDANPTLETLRRIFRPFGARVTVTFSQPTDEELISDKQRDLRRQVRAALAASRRKRSAGT